MILLLAPAIIAQRSVQGKRARAKTVRPESAVPSGLMLRMLRLEDERNLNQGELEKLLFHASPAVRQRAALAIGRIGDKSATKALIASLEKDKVAQVRMMSAFALGEMEDAQAAPALLAVLDRNDESLSVRARAVEALGKVASVAANAEPLGREKIESINAVIIKHLPDPKVALPTDQKLMASLAITALMRLRVPASVEPLTRQLKSTDADIRAEAANALARLRVPIAGAVPVLLEALSDRSPYVRANAARALGQGNDAGVIEPLVRCFDDPSGEVQVSAFRALGALSPLNDRRAVGALTARGERMLRDAALPRNAKADSPVNVNAALEIIAALENYKDERAKPLQQRLRDAVGEFKTSSREAKIEVSRPNHDEGYYLGAMRRPGTRPVAIIHTGRGQIRMELFADDAPLTVDNFISLAKRGYFNGIIFHRVVPNFVVQGGDPTGTGNGGPGWKIRCEINLRPYRRGTVGMALSGKDTGGSQFFITHSPQPHLDGGYTVFGQVISGMEVVDQITRGDVIEKVEIIEGRNKR